MAENDIIQITDEAHAWYGCLLVVDEVKPWGVIAYMTIPQTNDASEPPGIAFNRLKLGTYERVGTVTIVLGEEVPMN